MALYNSSDIMVNASPPGLRRNLPGHTRNGAQPTIPSGAMNGGGGDVYESPYATHQAPKQMPHKGYKGSAPQPPETPLKSNKPANSTGKTYPTMMNGSVHPARPYPTRPARPDEPPQHPHHYGSASAQIWGNSGATLYRPGAAAPPQIWGAHHPMNNPYGTYYRSDMIPTNIHNQSMQAQSVNKHNAGAKKTDTMNKNSSSEAKPASDSSPNARVRIAEDVSKKIDRPVNNNDNTPNGRSNGILTNKNVGSNENKSNANEKPKKEPEQTMPPHNPVLQDHIYAGTSLYGGMYGTVFDEKSQPYQPNQLTDYNTKLNRGPGPQGLGARFTNGPLSPNFHAGKSGPKKPPKPDKPPMPENPMITVSKPVVSWLAIGKASIVQCLIGAILFCLGFSRLIMKSTWGVGLELVYGTYVVAVGTAGLVATRRAHFPTLIACFVMNVVSSVLAVPSFVIGLMVTIPNSFTVTDTSFFVGESESIGADIVLAIVSIIECCVAVAISTLGCKFAGALAEAHFRGRITSRSENESANTSTSSAGGSPPPDYHGSNKDSNLS